MQLKNTIILITGAASGLGAATASYLASQGANIIALDKNPTANGLGLVCDITNEAEVKKSLQIAAKKVGVPRVCINFAGILDSGRIVGRDGPMALEHFRHVIDVNLLGTFNVMRLALEQMLKLEPDINSLERGVVINIASIAAFEGQIGQVAYSAAKAGIVGMTLPVAREMGEFGIRVVCIAPGVFETPMIKAASDKVHDSLLANTVFPKRFGQAHEIAELVGHVITNSMLNGEVIRLDGAMRMPPR